MFESIICDSRELLVIVMIWNGARRVLLSVVPCYGLGKNR
jgi:hypothetical protein